MADPRLLRFIAFYLPQFHPIPENDEWWGPGFTEWVNVAQAKPLFKGHYQPHIPADMGFYDLRVAETRVQQAQLAKSFGIEAFCYYHYWFEGRRLLQRPFEEVLRSGEPDFPFCLCWANENWTRRWDGSAKSMLLPQSYGPDDDRRHMQWLAGAFADPRYVRVDGRPLFLVYRVSDLPDPARTVEVWKSEAQRLGVGEPYLCAVHSFELDRRDPVDLSSRHDHETSSQPHSDRNLLVRLGQEGRNRIVLRSRTRQGGGGGAARGRVRFLPRPVLHGHGYGPGHSVSARAVSEGVWRKCPSCD